MFRWTGGPDQAVVSGEERGELRRLRDQVADRLEGT